MLYLPQVPPLSIPEEAEDLEEKEEETKDKDEDGNAIGKDEILTFPTNCPECNAPAETNMKMTCKSVFTFYCVDLMSETDYVRFFLSFTKRRKARSPAQSESLRA